MTDTIPITKAEIDREREDALNRDAFSRFGDSHDQPDAVNGMRMTLGWLAMHAKPWNWPTLAQRFVNLHKTVNALDRAVKLYAGDDSRPLQRLCQQIDPEYQPAFFLNGERVKTSQCNPALIQQHYERVVVEFNRIAGEVIAKGS